MGYLDFLDLVLPEERTRPNQAIDKPSGRSTVTPRLCPIGEKTTMGIVSSTHTTNLRSMSSTAAAPCWACSSWSP